MKLPNPMEIPWSSSLKKCLDVQKIGSTTKRGCCEGSHLSIKPSGYDCYIAIEHGRNSWFTYAKRWWFSSSLCKNKRLPEGKSSPFSYSQHHLSGSGMEPMAHRPRIVSPSARGHTDHRSSLRWGLRACGETSHVGKFRAPVRGIAFSWDLQKVQFHYGLWYNVGPPSDGTMVYKPHYITIVIGTINHSEIGVMCTNWTLS